MMSQSVELLLVEDNEDDAVIIQEVFADMRLATLIQVARDGEEALAYLQHKGKYKDVRMPDIVLLDINMPKRTALKCLRK
jgi:two-component system, chemotaxis family, response regulator Rcp1